MCNREVGFMSSNRNSCLKINSACDGLSNMLHVNQYNTSVWLHAVETRGHGVTVTN
jgi:hypothetical protein